MRKYALASNEKPTMTGIANGDGGTIAVDEAAVTAAEQRAAAAAKPKPKAQRNFTDPDSRIMKNSDGAFIQACNGQAVVDEAHHVIVDADATTCASDCPSLIPMLDAAQQNMGAAPRRRSLTPATAHKTKTGTSTTERQTAHQPAWPLEA